MAHPYLIQSIVIIGHARMNNKICVSAMLKWHGFLLLLLTAFIVDDVLTGLSRVCNVGSATTKKLLPFVATAAFLDARAPGAKNAHSKKEPFDADEDGYAIGEGKKHGKGIAALKHRADSLTRLGQKDMDDAVDMNKNGMHAN